MPAETSIFISTFEFQPNIETDHISLHTVIPLAVSVYNVISLVQQPGACVMSLEHSQLS